MKEPLGLPFRVADRVTFMWNNGGRLLFGKRRAKRLSFKKRLSLMKKSTSVFEPFEPIHHDGNIEMVNIEDARKQPLVFYARKTEEIMERLAEQLKGQNLVLRKQGPGWQPAYLRAVGNHFVKGQYFRAAWRICRRAPIEQVSKSLKQSRNEYTKY